MPSAAAALSLFHLFREDDLSPVINLYTIIIPIVISSFPGQLRLYPGSVIDKAREEREKKLWEIFRDASHLEFVLFFGKNTLKNCHLSEIAFKIMIHRKLNVIFFCSPPSQHVLKKLTSHYLLMLAVYMEVVTI